MCYAVLYLLVLIVVKYTNIIDYFVVCYCRIQIYVLSLYHKIKTNNIMKATDLKHGMTITNNDLVQVLESIGSKVYGMIDSENLGDLLIVTGFTASHNFNDCKTYNITKW